MSKSKESAKVAELIKLLTSDKNKCKRFIADKRDCFMGR